ncbi:MAG: hypothetical protein HYX92_18775 [Chloroflexi bacterium]|nr:hypothetical protein [Chloroflexota bacterium]
MAIVSDAGRAQAENLLGEPGRKVLSQVLTLIDSLAASLEWPPVRIDVRYTRDPEVAGWEYVLVVFVFDCSFEKADEYLHIFYNDLDNLARDLSPKQRNILRRQIFFDIETPVQRA